LTRRTLVLAAALGALAALPAAAQDIELQARAAGRTLPAGYYARIRQDPGVFELRRGWRSRASASIAAGGGPSSVVLPVEGAMRVAVIMTLFSDSPEAPFATSVIEDQLFGANPLGNLTQFYQELSGGKVTLTGTVKPWMRVGVSRSQAVGTSMGLGDDAQMGAYLVDAVTRLDGTTNFGQFDSDGPDGVPNSGDDDGFVDVTVFQFSEIAASCGGNGVWPHRSAISGWTGSPFTTNDLRPNGSPVMVDDYIIQSAVDCEGEPQNIATIAHETGHAFGLPDFYDPREGILPSQRRWVLGCWSLMAAGSWGCGDGASFGKVEVPSHMGAFEKLTLGWAQQVVAQPGWRREYVLQPVITGKRVLRVPLRGAEEYLLLEYRTKAGFDTGIPAPGVLVYHIEPGRNPRPCNSCARLYRVGLVEADGDGGLVRTALEGGNRGVAGDIFGGTRTLDDRGTANLRLNSGELANVSVEMQVAGGVARIFVSTLPEVVSSALLAPFLEVGQPPTADERAALDTFGNRNGEYDLGDLRAYLRSRPGSIVSPG
jgi:M6 family metalloprotease-like protein